MRGEVRKITPKKDNRLNFMTSHKTLSAIPDSLSISSDHLENPRASSTCNGMQYSNAHYRNEVK